MSPRAYRRGKREDAAQETRERIVRAARALLVDTGFYQVSLEDVARAADVTRATVYYQFGSKLGLLDAIALDATQRSGLARVFQAMAHPDAVEAVRGAIVEGARLWAADVDVFRQVIGLGMVDPELKSTAAERERMRRDDLRHVADRLAAQGRLKPGVTAEQATDVLFVLTSFTTFDSLHSTSRRTEGEIAAFLLNEARAIVDGL